MRVPVPCRQTVLARAPTCRVEYCSHVTVHVTVGDITLRMNPERFKQTVEMLEAAAARLGQTNEQPGLLC